MTEGVELIGKGCECIYPFEKHYITLVLEERIKADRKYLEEAKTSEWAKDPRSQAAMPIFARFISDLGVVLEKVKATPDC